jgi:peptide methionine sulfoxide reductase MsrA
MKTIGLSGVSNWDMEAFFQSINAIENVSPGLLHIHHEAFAIDKQNDFVEMVLLTYDPNKISIQDILDIHFSTFIPTINSFNEDCFFPRCRCIITYNDAEEKFELDKILLKIEEKYKETNETVHIKTLPIQVLKNNFKQLTEKESNLYAKDKQNSYVKSRIEPKLDKIKNLFPQYYQEVPSLNPDGTLKEKEEKE